jgi:hypothetical protein
MDNIPDKDLELPDWGNLFQQAEMVPLGGPIEDNEPNRRYLEWLKEEIEKRKQRKKER